MSRALASLVLAGLLPTAALTGDASVDIGKIEGIYRKRSQNGDSSGARYMTTDVLKIAQVEKGLAFFEIELHFFNGHVCEQSGIAAAEKGALVYREGKEADNPDPRCELHLVPKRGRTTLEDVGGHCRGMCGARGSFDFAEFSIARRQKMSATARSKVVADAKEAVEEHMARKQGKAEAKP